MEKQLKRSIRRIIRKQSFIRFDKFIIEKMGYEYAGSQEVSLDDIRRKALREFRRRTERKDFVTLPTMRRWFGSGDYKKPTREQIFMICFALGLDREETAEYLTIGIGEPTFQINDYKEMIFLYGIDNKLTYEECLDMIEYFEENVDYEIFFDASHTTKQFWIQYEINTKLDRQDFLQWMLSRADWFRGYSVTIMKYLDTLKKTIIIEHKHDSEQRLEEMLKEANYFKWKCNCKELSDNERINIQLFVSECNDDEFNMISESLTHSIIELSNIVYDTKETNRILLNTIYSTVKKSRRIKKNITRKSEYIMSEKYMSDLFRMPLLKVRLVNCTRALRVLRKMNRFECVPEWISRLCREIQNTDYDNYTVINAEEILTDYVKNNHRRCILLHRNDILPMLLYVAQTQYNRENPHEYDYLKARRLFVSIVDATMNACYMEPFNEAFELDSLLITCFQPEEMYSYSDMLDVYMSK